MNSKQQSIQTAVLSVGICFAGCLASCSDFLEVKPLEEIVLDNFWNEESDVENVMAGCYLAMQSQSFMDRAIVWGEARSENLSGGERISDDTSLANIMKENINANNAYTTWKDYYEVINRCNTVLKYAPKVAERDPNYTQGELRATFAEATALRDLCYFYLIRAFRDVPYSTDAFVDDTQKMALPATPFQQVLDSLTQSLERALGDAVMYYPESKPEYQTGRITQDAIHAMLCDMYLWKQDYQKVIEHADVVIASKQRNYRKEMEKLGEFAAGQMDDLINGYPLIADVSISGNEYGKAFGLIFGEGNSTESIFELGYSKDDAALSNYGVSVRYGSADGGNGSFCPSDLVANDIDDGQYAVFLNRYDVRSFENIYRQSATQFVVAKYASRNASVTVSTNPYRVIGQELRWPKNYCHANWVVYRLTDVMLMKAEAMTLLVSSNEGGAYSEEDNQRIRTAYSIVDAVNKRSFCNKQATSGLTFSRYSTKNNLLNLIYDERNRELMFEGKRWFDLVRRSMREGNTGYLITQAGRKYTNNKSAAESKLSKLDAIFWPYNEEELKVNNYLKQNPAFGSGNKSEFETTK